MKTLKTLIFSLLITCAGAIVHAEETQPEKVENAYGYFSYGFGIPTFLSLKLGKRIQSQHHGCDFGVGITPLVDVTELHAFASYLNYPNPNLNSQFYWGLGIKGGGLIYEHKPSFGYVGPGLILGKEFITNNGSRRFIQVTGGYGVLTTDGPKAISSINVSYGFAF